MASIILTETTLRDGSHTVAHRFTAREAGLLAAALDQAGIDIIEVGHGDGLAGSTCNYGFSAENEMDLIRAAANSVNKARVAVLLIPGIGTVADLKKAHEAGARVVRVATHVTEADVAQEHIHEAKQMGFLTIGFLMMAHRAGVQRLVEEAGKMVSYGADAVYLTDSSGAMLMGEVRQKVRALVKAYDVPVGFHGHNNLALAVGNSLAALEAGATYLDGSLGGLGAGAGNTATEVLVAALAREGYRQSADLFRAMDASSQVLKPIAAKYGVKLQDLQDPLMLGYADVYSSFLLHARRASEHHPGTGPAGSCGRSGRLDHGHRAGAFPAITHGCPIAALLPGLFFSRF